MLMLDGLLLLGLSSLASVATEPLPEPRDFFDPVQIGFEPDCTPNAGFQKIVEMMAGEQPDLSILQTVSGNIEHHLELDEPVNWHGLKLSGFHLYFGIERGPYNYSLMFADGPDDVRAVWNQRGWNLPPIGQARDIDGLEGYASIGISPSSGDGETTRVTCWRD